MNPPETKYTIFVDENGDEFIMESTTETNGTITPYTEAIEKIHISHEIAHNFYSPHTLKRRGVFDAKAHFEHIPSMEIPPIRPPTDAMYPIKRDRKNGGYIYDDKQYCFVLVPDIPESKKNIARLEFAIERFYEDLVQNQFKADFDPEVEKYWGKFLVYKNGVISLNYLGFMPYSDYRTFLRTGFCNVQWEVVDQLQAICEKFGYSLK